MEKHILIAEDDDMLRKSLAYFLRSNGFEVTEIENGEMAAAAIRTQTFDLVITDLNMPFVGGMELLSLIRNELQLTMPVIVLTASGVEKTELEAFDLGASEFISKPFSPSVLKARIEKLLR